MSMTDADRLEPGQWPLLWRAGRTYSEVFQLYEDSAQTVPFVTTGTSWRSQVRLEADEEATWLADIDITVVDTIDIDGVPTAVTNAIAAYASPMTVSEAVQLAQATRTGYWSLKQLVGDDAVLWLVGTVQLLGDPTRIEG